MASDDARVLYAILKRGVLSSGNANDRLPDAMPDTHSDPPEDREPDVSFTFRCMGETFYAWTNDARGGEIVVSCPAGTLPYSIESRIARRSTLAAINSTAGRRDFRIVLTDASRVSVLSAIGLDGDYEPQTLICSAATAAINALPLVATVRCCLEDSLAAV